MSSERSGQNRRAEEFTELSGKHQLQLLGYIYSMVHNLGDAEDLYQQSCIIMWRKFDEYIPESDFLKWACTIARYEVLNFIRTKEKRSRYFSEEYMRNVVQVPSQQDLDRVEARQQALSGCLERLKEKDQQLVMQCYDGTKKIQEVAAEIGRSSESVYTSLRRIRRILYHCINRTLALKGSHE